MYGFNFSTNPSSAPAPSTGASPSPFGTAPTRASSSPFGDGSAFGSRASSSSFGGSGLFGSSRSSTSTTLFGVSSPNPVPASSPATSLFGSSDFDGIAISAEKAAILGNMKRKHPSCFSSLRLQSESHRRSAYDHLVKVIEELKAVGGKGGPDSYDKVLIWLDDLEIYGFDMGWLREDVVKLRRRRMEVAAEKEAKRKAREELVKQIEAIDAELAAAAKDDDAAAVPEFLSDLFGA